MGVTGRPLSATFLFSPQSGNQSEREMKKGNLGCLLLLLRACYAYPTGALLQEGHPLLDRDTFLNDIDGFVLPAVDVSSHRMPVLSALVVLSTLPTRSSNLPHVLKCSASDQVQKTLGQISAVHL